MKSTRRDVVTIDCERKLPPAQIRGSNGRAVTGVTPLGDRFQQLPRDRVAIGQSLERCQVAQFFRPAPIVFLVDDSRRGCHDSALGFGPKWLHFQCLAACRSSADETEQLPRETRRPAGIVAVDFLREVFVAPKFLVGPKSLNLDGSHIPAYVIV